MPPLKLAVYGLNVALGGAAGAAGIATSPPFSSLIIAAACAGSASAIAFNTFNSSEKPVNTIVRRITKAFVFFLIGALFGLFMGGSLAGILPFDRVGATYLGGLLGYGLVAVLLSGKMRDALGEAIFASLRFFSKRGGSHDDS